MHICLGKSDLPNFGVWGFSCVFLGKLTKKLDLVNCGGWGVGGSEVGGGQIKPERAIQTYRRHRLPARATTIIYRSREPARRLSSVTETDLWQSGQKSHQSMQIQILPSYCGVGNYHLIISKRAVLRCCFAPPSV